MVKQKKRKYSKNLSDGLLLQSRWQHSQDEIGIPSKKLLKGLRRKKSEGKNASKVLLSMTLRAKENEKNMPRTRKFGDMFKACRTSSCKMNKVLFSKCLEVNRLYLDREVCELVNTFLAHFFQGQFYTILIKCIGLFN